MALEWIGDLPLCEHVSTAMAPHLLKKNTLHNTSVWPLQTKQPKVIHHPFYMSSSIYENALQHSNGKKYRKVIFWFIWLSSKSLHKSVTGTSLRSNPHERLHELAWKLLGKSFIHPLSNEYSLYQHNASSFLSSWEEVSSLWRSGHGTLDRLLHKKRPDYRIPLRCPATPLCDVFLCLHIHSFWSY